MSNIFEKDKLGREPVIRSLTSLIESDFELNVLAVNASWGMGKTTFVEMWKKYLDSKDIPNLYFSAWEDDYSNEPLIAILGEIQNHIKQNQTIEAKAEKIFVETIKKIAKIGIKGGWELAKGFLQQKCGEGYDKFVEIACEEFEKSVENYSEEKTLLKEIKESIKQIFQQITDKKFVIFIDELDRCRPLYAIELLERVKHLFGTSGVVFVLSIDKEQLGESIKSQYGNIDANQYLKRFFDLEYQLDSSDRQEYCSFLYENLKRKNQEQHNPYYTNLNLGLIEIVVRYKNLTLREIRQCFQGIKILISMDSSLYCPNISSDFGMQVAIILVFLDIKNQDSKEIEEIYSKLRQQNGNNIDRYVYDKIMENINRTFNFLQIKRANRKINNALEDVFHALFESVYSNLKFLEDFKDI